MDGDLKTETGCTILVRYPLVRDMSSVEKIVLVLDMGSQDGRISPEVLLTPGEASRLIGRLAEAVAKCQG